MIATVSNMVEHPVIELVHPMPGFPEDITFALRALDEDNLLLALESTSPSGPRFLVMSPSPFFPDYSPVIPDDVADDLGLADDGEALGLLVVHAGASLAETTVNLRAPLVINVANGRAAQIVLDDADLAVTAPLLADMP